MLAAILVFVVLLGLAFLAYDSAEMHYSASFSGRREARVKASRLLKVAAALFLGAIAIPAVLLTRESQQSFLSRQTASQTTAPSDGTSTARPSTRPSPSAR